MSDEETPVVPVGDVTPMVTTQPEPKIETIPAPEEAKPLVRPSEPKTEITIVHDETRTALAKAEATPPDTPFIATEYIFQGPSGNHKRVVVRAGSPTPSAPDAHHTRLIGVLNLHPFDTAAARDAALT